jgi:ElaB/YqjD/DUF883 family membrane-anchored ribosome-binding protein
MNAKPTTTPRTDETAPSLRDRASEAYDGARERAIEAYDSARERAAEAGTKARDGIGQAPFLALGGGLALGALLAALLPKTKTEDKLLGRYGEKITGGAKAAADAAREAGREKLTELNITRDAGTNAVQSLFKGLGDAARVSGEAALGAVRKKD